MNRILHLLIFKIFIILNTLNIFSQDFNNQNYINDNFRDNDTNSYIILNRNSNVVEEKFNAKKLILLNSGIRSIPKELNSFDQVYIINHDSSALSDLMINLSKYNIHSLTLVNFKKIVIPKEIEFLNDLHYLNIEYCDSLIFDYSLPNKLEHLYIGYSKYILWGETFSPVFVKQLSFEIDSLYEFPSNIDKFSNLSELNIFRDCDTKKDNTSNTNYHNLENAKFIKPLNSITFSIYSPKIPKELYNLLQIKKLSLFTNKLQTLDDEIKKLVNLETLDLSMNNFEEIPKNVFELPKLKYLNLSQNNISKFHIVEKFDNHSLMHIDMQLNKLKKEDFELLKILLPNTKIFY